MEWRRGSSVTPSEKERQALVFNTQITAVPDEAPIHSMGEIVAALQDIFGRGDAVQYLTTRQAETEDEGEDNQEEAPPMEDVRGVLFIGEINVQADGTTTVLVKAGDPEGTRPAFINIRTGDTRIVQRQEGESNGYAAHLIIGPPRSGRNQIGVHRCALERMPHLGRTVVFNFLNRLIRKHFKKDDMMVFDHPESRTLRQYYPKLDTYAQLSHRLRDDISEGKLSHIEFISRRADDQADEAIQIEIDRYTLKVKPTRHPINQEDSLGYLNRVKRWGLNKGFEEMQLFFKKIDNRPGFSPRFTTELDDAADALYSRLEALTGFSDPLPQCPSEIHRELEAELLQVVSNPQLWR